MVNRAGVNGRVSPRGEPLTVVEILAPRGARPHISWSGAAAGAVKQIRRYGPLSKTRSRLGTVALHPTYVHTFRTYFFVDAFRSAIAIR